VLTDYYILEQHFNWVCDGGIRKTVERKMVNELQIMEQYLLHQGKEAVTNIITTYANDCNQHIDESGSTYSWVGILRAGEKHWGTVPENALFRTELEGINGNSPQLITPGTAESLKVQAKIKISNFLTDNVACS